jgi:glutathione S-transferase
MAICEYFEETMERTPLIGASAADRAEVRRLTYWFNQKFYAEVGHPLLAERMYKRLVDRSPPDGGALRMAARNLEAHLGYIEYLLDHRRWLSGATLGLADLAAAAHLSVVDYLSGLDWRGYASAKQWYSAIKSRPAFRTLLTDRMEGLAPPPHYDKLDF